MTQSKAGHLSRRFFGSLSPRPPAAADEAWATENLTDEERRLWRRMSRADRRHAVGVARHAAAALGPDQATRPVIAAALLHDVGKLAAGLGTYGRVVATVLADLGGRAHAELWSDGRGVTRKVGLYLRHAELGADMLAMAGSDALTVTWAREHHSPEERWTLPDDIAAALKAADDD